MAITLDGTDGITTTGLTSSGIDDNATSTAITIDANENVGIGTDSPSTPLDVKSPGTTSDVIRATNNTGTQDINITQRGSSGWAIKSSLDLDLHADYNNDTSSAASNVRIFTDNSERMRIDSSGNVLVGGTAANGKLTVQANNGESLSTYTSQQSALNDTRTVGFYAKTLTTGAASRFAALLNYKHAGITNAVAMIQLSEEDGGTQFLWSDNSGVFRTSASTGNVGTTGGTVVGTQTSDERVKDIEAGFEYGLDTVMRLEPIAFTYTDGAYGGARRLGFGAQTTQKIIPEAIYQTNECVDGYEADPEDSTKQTPKSDRNKLAIDQSNMVPVLVKAIQEQQAIIEDLQTRLSAVETN